MPVLADIQKTQQELTLALAELDNIEAAFSGNQGTSSTRNANTQREQDKEVSSQRIQFLTEENKELAQVIFFMFLSFSNFFLLCRKMKKFSRDLKK